MRSWYPIPASCLDNKRLLGEHNELLIMALSIKSNGAWTRHPETKRWMGFSRAMKKRHDAVAEEMVKRGMNHKSEWPEELICENDSDGFPNKTVEPLEDMFRKLKEKQNVK